MIPQHEPCMQSAVEKLGPINPAFQAKSHLYPTKETLIRRAAFLLPSAATGAETTVSRPVVTFGWLRWKDTSMFSLSGTRISSHPVGSLFPRRMHRFSRKTHVFTYVIRSGHNWARIGAWHLKDCPAMHVHMVVFTHTLYTSAWACRST